MEYFSWVTGTRWRQGGGGVAQRRRWGTNQLFVSVESVSRQLVARRLMRLTLGCMRSVSWTDYARKTDCSHPQPKNENTFLCIYFHTSHINTSLMFDIILSRSAQPRKAAAVYTKPAACRGRRGGISRFALLHLQSFVPLRRRRCKASAGGGAGGCGGSRCESTRSSRLEGNGSVSPLAERRLGHRARSGVNGCDSAEAV